MKPAALATETIDVAAFLAISRKHLGLSSTTLGGANARTALNPFKRHAPGSRAKPNSRVDGMRRYGNLAQSLLLATGLFSRPDWARSFPVRRLLTQVAET